MYSSGIAHGRSSNEVAPSVNSKSDSTMRFTWRATERPSSSLSMTPARTSASPKRRRFSPSFMKETARLNSSSVMRPSATRASPSRSFFMLLAANTTRPWSKKIVFTILRERTCRSPLRRSRESREKTSETGVTARSTSIGRNSIPRDRGPAPARRPG